jgi:hypothetical protein
MDFDQGEFNFDAPGNENGYRKWRDELDSKRRAFETRWGVILTRRVTVKLRDFEKPVSGMLRILKDPQPGAHRPPLLTIKGIEFTPADVESIVQIEDSPATGSD